MYGYLMHHGVKGMKWGIRRYQDYNGELTALGRQHYGYKAIPIKTFEKGQIANLQYKSGGERVLKKEIKEFKNDENPEIREWAKNLSIPKHDIIIKKGSQFQRITDTKDESKLKRLYVTQQVGQYYISEFLRKDSFVRVYSLKNDVKLAGRDTVNQVLNDIGVYNLGNNRDDVQTGKRHGKLSWYKYSNEDLFAKTTTPNAQKYIINELKKRGYNGLIDPMDAGYFSNSAYIITDKSLRKVRDLTLDEAREKYKDTFSDD